MLGRFLKKSIPEDQRSFYRREPGKNDALAIKLICANGAPIPGRLIDLSTGGAAVEFDMDLTGELEIDCERELVISSFTQKSVRGLAQVRSVPIEGGENRYGFMFLDGAALFAQLDESFYKFFNRRRFRRAKPALGERIRAELGFANVLENVDLQDVSMSGAVALVSHDIAAMLTVDMPTELRIHVPKTDLVLHTYAIIRHFSQDSRGVRVGFSTQPNAEADTKRNTKRAQAALSDYIKRRIDEIQRYNSAF